MTSVKRLLPIIVIALLCSCKAYKQDIMFRLDDDFTEEDLSSVTEGLERNYILKPNDRFQLNVFTNEGERLIDPNREFAAIIGAGGGQGGRQGQLGDRFMYTIRGDSMARIPMIGDINLVGLTLFEAELKLAEEFNNHYEGSFVKLEIENRRVFVLGVPGGKVIPLENENTGLIEIISQAGGINRNGKANNIRLVRGDQVFMIDLTTISGMLDSNMNVETGDIIYVEPWRRPWKESLRDLGPIFSIISSTITLALVIQNL